MTPTQSTPEPVGAPLRIPRLGEMLIERGRIPAEDLERALELQRERGDKLGKILVDMGLIAQRDLLAVLSLQLGVPWSPSISRRRRSGNRGSHPPLPAPVRVLPGRSRPIPR